MATAGRVIVVAVARGNTTRHTAEERPMATVARLTNSAARREELPFRTARRKRAGISRIAPKEAIGEGQGLATAARIAHLVRVAIEAARGLAIGVRTDPPQGGATGWVTAALRQVPVPEATLSAAALVAGVGVPQGRAVRAEVRAWVRAVAVELAAVAADGGGEGHDKEKRNEP